MSYGGILQASSPPQRGSFYRQNARGQPKPEEGMQAGVAAADDHALQLHSEQSCWPSERVASSSLCRFGAVSTDQQLLGVVMQLSQQSASAALRSTKCLQEHQAMRELSPNPLPCICRHLTGAGCVELALLKHCCTNGHGCGPT